MNTMHWDILAFSHRLQDYLVSNPILNLCVPLAKYFQNHVLNYYCRFESAESRVAANKNMSRLMDNVSGKYLLN